MHTLLHGWRRKAGLVTLVMALAVFGMWIRSQISRDWLTTTLNGEVHDVISYNGRIYWWASAINLEKRTAIETAIIAGEARVDHHRREMLIWRAWSQRNQGREWIIPYWPFVLLVTLLAAYLILWKPQKRQACPN